MTARPKNGSWMADFTAAGIRYREFGFATKELAEEWELTARAAIIAKKPIPKPQHIIETGGPKHTIGALRDHVASVHWASKKSAAGLILQADLFVRFCGEDAAVAECLTTKKVDDYVASLQGRVAGGTINRRLAAVSKLARYAVAYGYIPKAPMLSKQRESPGRIRFFTDEEEAAILATLHRWSLGEEHDLFVFLCETGARLGEATALRWEDLHPNGRAVTFWDTKDASGAGNFRTIVLTARAQEAIVNRRARAPRAVGPFTSLSLRQLRTTWARLRNHFQPRLDDAVIHTYRHTCASRLVMAGLDLTRVQKWMGHKTIQTTLRYSHLSPKAMEEVAAVLELRRAPPST